MEKGRTVLVTVVAAVAVIVLIAGAVSLLDPKPRDVTWEDLVKIDRDSAETAMSLDESETVRIQNVTAFTLLHAGVPKDLMRSFPHDWNMMSKNTGLMDDVGKEFTDTAKIGDLNRILNNSKPLAEAFDGGITEPFFYDNLPQPVFFFTPVYDDYSNENSEIIRYCVYVETEYDTDSDGKRDLIEVYLQIPRTAMEGGYKAPVILVASPYDHGVNFEEPVQSVDGYDMSKIRSQPDVRVPIGSMSAWDAAMAAKPSDWHYGEGEREYMYGSMLDYYLPRGYAVAICGLLGSYGSEGYPCTGLDLELLAVKSVIEWFDGDAVGYTSKDSLIVTEADWCSGNVGMYGISYLGTVQIGVAAMGIDNLKTVIPSGAISNWYEYVFQKGGWIDTDVGDAFTAYLASFISTARDPTVGDIQRYMQKLAYDETSLIGQYSDGESTFWIDRDYTRMDIDTETSIMLIHGINDHNVPMNEFARTMEMFKDSGVTMKAFLHQGAHQVPMVGFVFNLGEDHGLETMNKWLSRYLFGKDTGVEEWPDIQVQSNLDGSWSGYDGLDPASEWRLESSEVGTETVWSDTPEDMDIWIELETADRDVTILGGEVNIRLSSGIAERPDYPVCVLVYDIYEPGMKAYHNSSPDVVDYVMLGPGDPEKNGVWYGSTLYNQYRFEFELKDTACREISRGAAGLGYYGETVDLESMRVQDREPGEYYDYVLDLNPTVYKLKEGHTIAICITTSTTEMMDSYKDSVPHYNLTVDLSSIELTLELI